jgi:DNA-nicking Smr family endonuclease
MDNDLALTDQEIWAHITARIKKLHSNKYTGNEYPEFLPLFVPPPLTEAVPVKLMQQALPPSVVVQEVLTPLVHGELVNLDKTTRSKFLRGNYKIDARLDLHGKTQIQAYDLLRDFIEDAYYKKKRCLLVITGKGNSPGILRQAVPDWMNNTALRPKQLKPKNWLLNY